MTAFDALALDSLSIALAVISVIFLISGIDDLLMNCMFVCWRVYHRFVLLRGRKRVNETTLDEKPQQWAAIMVPAWHEEAVIGKMLDNAVRTIDYENYRIFVGVYPNDSGTIAAVRFAQNAHPDRIVPVMLDHPGPTNKSDCLNTIVSAIFAWEKRQGVEVAFMVLDDAEDMPPRYHLKVLNLLIPRKDIVQLPVFPTPVKWWEFTSGHYMDEFAISHQRDMRTREWLTGVVPSSGVGTGISRRAALLAIEANGRLFNEDSLTEDYELPLMLSRLNVSAAFFESSIEPVFDGAIPLDLIRPHKWADGVPAIRSSFPRRFWPAVRQKTRWVLGITLQGWEHLGWHGGLAQRYMLFRDRKALATNFVTLIGYLLAVAIFAFWAFRAIALGRTEFPNVIDNDSWLWTVIAINLALAGMQAIGRVICTWRIYGPMHGLLAVPRMFWGGVINFFATWRAAAQYFKARREKARIPWDKTAHDFP